MSRVVLTKGAAPTTPASNKSAIYVDTADTRLKQIDSNGVISILSHDGLQDRNVLDNGGLMIQQRVATASTAIAGISTTTRAGVVADRWAVTTSVATNVLWAQIDTNAAPETSLLARYYGTITKSTALKKVMISQYLIFNQMAHLRNQKVRLSFKHNQKVGSPQVLRFGIVQLQSTGTVDAPPAFLSGAWSTVDGTDPAWNTNTAAITPDASPTPENGTVVGNWIETTTVATTWTRASGVFTIPSNCKGLYVVVFTNTGGASTDSFGLAEFQLTQGAEITDFVQTPHAEELVRCQRFFCKSFPLTVVPAASVSEATGGSGATGMIGKAGATALAANYEIRFPVVMWKTPTVTYFTPTSTGAQCWRFSGAAAAAQTATASRASSTTDRGVVVTATGDAAGTVGDLVGVHFTADAEVVV